MLKRLFSQSGGPLLAGFVAFSHGIGLAQAAAPGLVVGQTNILHYPPANAAVPRIMVDRHRQQIQAAAASQTFHDFRFTDRTEQSGITFVQQSVDDALKWWKPVHYDHGAAVAAADVDGDGRTDLYFVKQRGPNELWRNLGGGKFENVTSQAGVAVAERIHVGASFADIDNDGDPDLYVTTVKMGNALFENLGGARFRDITHEAGLDHTAHSSGAVFFDYDLDGRLDLFLCNVGVYTTDKRGSDGAFQSATNAFDGHLYPERAEYSVLYRNLGGRKFRDVSVETGLRHQGWTGDATFADLNGDRYPDLYVLNMQGDDHYYENMAGRRFVDKTAAYFPKTPWGAMGIKFFDYNLDGLPDLLITDMHSDMADPQSKAGRFTMAMEFEKVKSDRWATKFWDDPFLQGASNNIFGSAFYLNLGEGQFEEISARVGVETYWPWGVTVADLNADGYADVFITAGMGWPFRYGINSLLLNNGGKGFFDAEFLVGLEPRVDGRIDKPMFVLDAQGQDREHELAEQLGQKVLVYGSLSSRSSVAVDLDEDGDLDLVTNEMNDRPMVLLSNLQEKNATHYLKVKLIGKTSNRDGLGARVRVRAGGKTFTQWHDGTSGYLAQSSMPLYFGLAEAAEVSALEVLWPSGKRQLRSVNFRADTLVVVNEAD